MKRRAWIKSIALASAGLSVRSAFADENKKVTGYLETLRREDGGYGWAGQERSHLTPSCFAIKTYSELGDAPPRAKELAKFVRENHPAVLKKLEQERRVFEMQQLEALELLGQDAPADLKERILNWTKPLAYLKQYERSGHPLFASEMAVMRARMHLAAPVGKDFVEYRNSRRRENGSFNNTPASDGTDGHVMHTYWAHQWLHSPIEPGDKLVPWLQNCQLPNGGFTYCPNPEFGGVDDVAYTFCAVALLKFYRAKPNDARQCIVWLNSLRNRDGGFGDRPGWASNPMATYYAVAALKALGAEIRSPSRRAATRQSLPRGLNVFSIQLEAHGQGSPAEAVQLARALKIHLWGAKNARPEWVARAQAIAGERKASTQFFVSNEEYGTWVSFPGQGTYSHTSDIIAPAGAEFGKPVGTDPVTWPEFREKRLKPLEKGHGRLIWQFGENEELVRMLLDDSLRQEGFAAISTYHFGNPDFTNTEPFLHRWRGKIPFVALQDAHGPEPWWFADMTTAFRTLFLAEEPTWDAWLQALKNNWVVPVRRDQWTAGKTWMHAPSDELADFVRAREKKWRWWDNPDIARPLLSIVALRPDDKFEAGHPERGVRLRIRCAWQNTPQGLLKSPISEFVRLTIDGETAAPELFSRRRPNGLFDDHFHFAQLEESTRPRVATVTARLLATGSEISKSISF